MPLYRAYPHAGTLGKGCNTRPCLAIAFKGGNCGDYRLLALGQVVEKVGLVC